MQRKNKDGSNSMEWLKDRKDYFKTSEKTRDVIQWYLKFERQTNEFKKELILKYNKYINESANSRAGQLYQDCKKAMRAGDFDSLKILSIEARQRLVDKNFRQPPSQYDPSVIRHNFFVSSYIDIINEIDKQNGKKQDDLTNNVKTILL